MKFSRNICNIIFAFCAVIFVAPVWADGFWSEPNFTPSEPYPISVTVATDKPKYRVGEIVTFIVCARNVSKEAQELSFSSSQEFDVNIRQGDIFSFAWRWRWGQSQKFSTDARKWKISAGETRIFWATWDQRTPDWGTPAPRGTHKAIANITTAEGIRSNVISLNLVE